MTKKLEGKVAKILNERELAINIGKKAGVKEGMKFEVLKPEPILIRDPDTQEKIGIFDQVKIRVKVINVEERFSKARTYEIYKTRKGISGSPLASLSKIFGSQRMETRVKTLRTDEFEFKPLNEQSSFVKVGDRVRQIIEDTNEQ